MHQALFDKPDEWDTTESAAIAAFEGYANTLDLELPAFQTCMSDRRYRPNVDANQEEGSRLGVTGTPAFVINGKILAGAHPYSVFKNAIDRELKSAQ